jgi:Peptidase family M23
MGLTWERTPREALPFPQQVEPVEANPWTNRIGSFAWALAAVASIAAAVAAMTTRHLRMSGVAARLDWSSSVQETREMPRPIWRAALIAAIVAVCAAAPAPAGAVDRYTPLVQSVMSKPRWFSDSDGRFHVAYELKLTNGFPVPVTVTSVGVRDVVRRRTIERLSGDALTASMSLLASPTEPATTVPDSGIGVVWFDIVVPRRQQLPRSIRHTLTVAVPPGLPVPTTITDTGGFARVDRRPPVRLGAPLRGPGWVAVGSCCDGPHRRALQPVNGKLYLGQRFAIDWNGVDAQNRFVVGDPDVTTNWTFYAKPVLAVADARVVAAVDRFPDQTPNHPNPVTLREADGNYVILALGHGRFAFYAHLKPGSIRVNRGDRVRRGEVLGLLGNSGSSTGPHLHFHMMTGRSPLASDGLPYVFDRFRLTGRIPPLDDALEATINAGEPVPVDPAGAGPRRRELPLGRDVVSFGSG